MTIRITLNGDEREFATEMSVADLLGELGFEQRKIAVERNLEIVPRSTYADVRIENGDRLEIVRFVGGG